MCQNEKNLDSRFEEYVAELKTLNEQQKNKVRDLLYKYRAVFSDKPGCANVYEHKIILKNQKTVV